MPRGKTIHDTSFKARLALADWLRVPGRTVGKSSTDLAREASEALSYSFSYKQVYLICKDLGLSPEKRVKIEGEAYLHTMKQNLAAAEHRITELESDVQKLIHDLKILKSFYINTSKKPKEVQQEFPFDQSH